MKITRPHFLAVIPGTYRRASRTALSTLTSKNLIQSASGISPNGFASKMPRLFTSTSASGTSRTNASTPLAVPRSAATPPYLCPFHGLPDLLDRGRHARLRPPVHDDRRALRDQRGRDRQPDSRGGARHDRGPRVDSQIHLPARPAPVSVARSWSCPGPQVPGIPSLSTAKTLRQKRMAIAHESIS